MSKAATINTPLDQASAVSSRRIFRLCFGTTASLVFSQIVSWDLSFLAPVFTMFLLAVPLPAPTLPKAIALLLALIMPICLGITLIPFLNEARWAGVLLVACGLFYSFYFTAKGGSPIIGTFLTVGLTLVVTIGSLSLDILLILIEGLCLGVIFGLVFVWVAHAVFPEFPADPALAGKKPPAPVKPDLREARRSAFRSLLITFPVALALLFSSNSAAYVVVMIKVASMGQQASTDQSKTMGRSLLESTIWGGIGAVLAWQALSIWPAILPYGLIIAIASLLYGSKIFSGLSMHPKGGMWSYAFLTMIVVLAPAVTDSQGGTDAGAAFYTRLFLIGLVAVYGTVAVAVFDAFWRRKPEEAP